MGPEMTEGYLAFQGRRPPAWIPADLKEDDGPI